MEASSSQLSVRDGGCWSANAVINAHQDRNSSSSAATCIANHTAVFVSFSGFYEPCSYVAQVRTGFDGVQRVRWMAVFAIGALTCVVAP